MSLTITPIYAGFLALLLVALSARVIRARIVSRISIGDRNNREMRKKIRVQANFAEYAPMGLVLLACAEVQGLPEMGLHGLGAMLLLGRLSHAVGMGATPQRLPLRSAGMVLTLGMILLTAAANLFFAMI
ncbi:MAPEG family protein [Roseovarius aestuariivivens]|uniref:MAPEG family protein n=1 Tax=Roseovarius aestuariivivens TaxID=1888910 RepID=UPI001080A5A1|nr:MAPEG family protein [Roseovarius aestuariivivens]